MTLKSGTRRIALGTTMVAVGAGAAGFGAPIAAATQTSTSCVGTLVQHTALKGDSSGTVLGYLDIYWDSATGQNCAMTQSSSATYGVAKSMTVEMWECVTDTPNANSDCSGVGGTGVSDFSLSFRYYAGPVSTPGSGHCIDALGQVIMSNGDLAEYDTGASHC